MQRTLTVAAVVAVTLFAPQIASAQDSSQDQTHRSIREQVKDKLEQDGFTNIRIMPEAFLVRATDPDGNPVEMIVNADALTAMMSQDHENANSQEHEGQTTSKSAKMTGNTDTSPGDARQNTSKSSKMSGGPGHPNGMAAELQQDETQQPLTLTNSQRVAIWQALGNQATQASSTTKLRVGQVLPNGLSLDSLPNSVSNQVPAVKPYDYVMLNNQLLIVDPSTRKIVAIIAD